MSYTQRFGYLKAAHEACVGTKELPALGPKDVLVKQLACNICTTDYQQWMGLREHQGYPMAGGHEGSGVVVEVGSEVKSCKPGDLVAVSHTMGCGICSNCRAGDTDHCLSVHKENANGGGKVVLDKYGYAGGMYGFADYNIRDERTIYVMNPDLDPAEAGFLEPVSTAVRGIKKLRLAVNEKCVVIGAGTMGLVNAQVARALGGDVIVSELMPKKLETAKSMGFPVIDGANSDPVEEVMKWTNGEGADCVIVAVGATKANEQAIQMLKKLDGRVLLFAAGYPVPQIPVDSNVVHYRRIELIGTFGSDYSDYVLAAKLLNQRLIDCSKMVEEVRYPLDKFQEAMEAASTPGMYRVCVLCSE